MLDSSTLNELSKFSKVFIACSGGIDSMVLLHQCQQAHLTIHVLHCNFQLRGEESLQDEAFLKTYCQQHNIPISIKSFNTTEELELRRKNIQETARELRYEWFDEMLANHSQAIVCTAHHKDDNREQLLLKLISSGKIHDLSGILQSRPGYFRPLLEVPKSEIQLYAQANQLEWREDKTNIESKYTRNKVRNKLIPSLLEIDSRALTGIDKLLKEVNTLKFEINQQLDKLFAGIDNQEEFFVSTIFWVNQLTLFKELFLIHWMRTAILLPEIENLVHNANGGAHVLHNDYYIMKEQNGLWFGKKSLEHFSPVSLSTLISGEVFAYAHYKFWLSTTEFSTELSCVSIPICKAELSTYSIKLINSGETVVFNSTTKRSFKKLMNDLKKPHFERKRQLALYKSDIPVQLIDKKGYKVKNTNLNKINSDLLFLNVLFGKFALIEKM